MTITCQEKIDCSCGYFEATGMVCRHIFFICVTENIKDISKLRISDKWILSLEMEPEKHFCTSPELINNAQERSPKDGRSQDSVQIIEITTQKCSLDTVEQEPQAFNLQNPKINQTPVNNFEKVLTKKGAPKGKKIYFLNLISRE